MPQLTEETIREFLDWVAENDGEDVASVCLGMLRGKTFDTVSSLWAIRDQAASAVKDRDETFAREFHDMRFNA